MAIERQHAGDIPDNPLDPTAADREFEVITEFPDDPNAAAEQPQGEQPEPDFLENLAERMDEDELTDLGADLIADVEADHELDGECHRFNDAPELEARLRDSPAEAFYSELYYDRRLTRCGKAQFSVSDFALGLAGAVQTAQHLLRVCELPFYRKYGAHMGAPFSKASP